MFAIYIEWVARCFFFSYIHAHAEDDDDCETVIVHRVLIHHLFLRHIYDEDIAAVEGWKKPLFQNYAGSLTTYQQYIQWILAEAY